MERLDFKPEFTMPVVGKFWNVIFILSREKRSLAIKILQAIFNLLGAGNSFGLFTTILFNCTKII
jgi:hypothetical protein